MPTRPTLATTMPRETAPSTAEQAWLDDLFEQVVARLEDGLPVDAVALCAGHEHLRAQIGALVALAEQITIGAPRSLPQIEGYQVLREIGRGGMGAVYLARQQRVGGRLVALKLLPAGIAVSPQSRARLEAEAHTIARLAHPNIVVVHDLIADGAGCAYAMEWVDGCTLADLFAHIASRHAGSTASSSRDAELRAAAELLDQGDLLARHRTYVAFICRIGVALARALAAVHGAGLVHRDVKPSNVLLRRDGTPLLSDFGLVRDTEATLTQAGHFAGTLAYAPPEQLRGDSAAIDARSDVYALGATLYHALALRVPIAGTNPQQLATQIERGLARPLRKVNPRIPFDLQTIVAKALDADPRRRYQTAAELADDLERLLSLQPIRARPAGLVTRTIKLVRRNRGTLTAGVAAAIATLALCVGTVVMWLFVPRWVVEHVRTARLALVDPDQQTQLFNALFFHDQTALAPDVRAVALEGLDEALGAYARALRLRPWNGAIRRERDVVRLARETAAAARRSPGSMQPAHLGRPESTVEGTVQPCCLEYARRLLATGTPAPAAELRLNERSADELRDLGLLAYLVLDLQTAIAAWTQLDRQSDADALVDAALGQAFLLLDQPARAYPRLRAANEAFPGVGFLATALADAAIQCGDTDKAGRVLAQARGMSRLPSMDGLERIEARLLAATGQVELARRKFEWLLSPGRGSGVAQVDYARFLAARGEHAGAMRQYAGVARDKGVRNRRVRMEFTRAMDRWWASLAWHERWRIVRGSLDEPPTDPNSLVMLVRLYCETEPQSPDSLGNIGVGPVQTTLSHRPEADAPRFSAALLPSDSSPSLETREIVSLGVLARRMEVSDMSFWSATQEYPALVKDALAGAWLAPRSSVPARCLHAAVGVEIRLRHRVRAALLASATAAALASMSPGQTLSYDPNLGTLPEAQGWTRYEEPPASPEPTVAGGALHQGPTEYFGVQIWRNSVPIDFELGFSFEMQLAVVSSTGEPGTNRAGYTFAVTDSRQRWFVVGVTSTGVFIGNTPSWAGTPFVPFDTSGQHTYQFNVAAGMGVLSIDATPIVSLAIGSVLAGFPTNGVAFGDMTNAGASETYLYGLTYTAPRCDAPPCFQGLADLPNGATESGAFAVSADGTTVVGYGKSASGQEPFLWRPGTGMIGLGTLPGGQYNGEAFDVSGDGSVVVGRTDSASSDQYEAFRWTQAGGMQALGDLSGDSFSSSANGVSSDGAVVAGHGDAGGGWVDEAWYWTAAGGMVPMGQPASGLSNDGARGISANGTWVVGYSVTTASSPGRSEACRWSAATGWEALGFLPGGSIDASTANDVADDGSVVVGYGQHEPTDSEAFEWTAGVGMIGLGDLPGGTLNSGAVAISPDASLIVGYGHSASGYEAVVWDSSRTLHRAVDWLSLHGVDIPAGWVLGTAYDVAIHGNVVSMCGYGRNSSGNTEAWVARYECLSIADAPQSLAACAGEPATLTVGASGDGPLTYQWRKDGIDIPGATGSSFTLAAAAPEDAGVYDVLVTGCTTLTSASAVLVVDIAPAITQSPGDLERFTGQTASFSAAAEGVPAPALQWRRNGIDLVDGETACGSIISGAGSPALTIANVHVADAGNYDCVATNHCGQVLTAAAGLAVHARGDADCDGDVDFFDIDLFVAKLGCPGAGPACDDGCPWEHCDIDADGDVDFFDIDPFVGLLGTTCP